MHLYTPPGPRGHRFEVRTPALWEASWPALLKANFSDACLNLTCHISTRLLYVANFQPLLLHVLDSMPNHVCTVHRLAPESWKYVNVSTVRINSTQRLYIIVNATHQQLTVYISLMHMYTRDILMFLSLTLGLRIQFRELKLSNRQRSNNLKYSTWIRSLSWNFLKGL